jgi:hypothetical protein
MLIEIVKFVGTIAVYATIGATVVPNSSSERTGSLRPAGAQLTRPFRARRFPAAVPELRKE